MDTLEAAQGRTDALTYGFAAIVAELARLRRALLGDGDGDQSAADTVLAEMERAIAPQLDHLETHGAMLRSVACEEQVALMTRLVRQADLPGEPSSDPPAMD